MVLIPYGLHMVTVSTGGLFEIVHGLNVIPVEVVLHDVVDNLRLWLDQEGLN